MLALFTSPDYHTLMDFQWDHMNNYRKDEYKSISNDPESSICLFWFPVSCLDSFIAEKQVVAVFRGLLFICYMQFYFLLNLDLFCNPGKKNSDLILSVILGSPG